MTKTDDVDDSDDVKQWFSRHIGYPCLLFLKVKSCWIFFRQGKFQGQLTKVLANAKVDGQRLGQKSKSILDMMQFDTKVHIKEMLRFFAMFGFIWNSMFAFVS